MRPIVACLAHHSLWRCFLATRFEHLLALLFLLFLLLLVGAVQAVALELRRQGRVARRARTLDTLEDLDDLEQDTQLSAPQRAALEGKDREELERLLAADIEAGERIADQARFYEGLARGLRHGVLERRVLMAELAPRITEVYELLLPYLELERARHAGAYRGFARLYRDALKHVAKPGKGGDGI